MAFVRGMALVAVFVTWVGIAGASEGRDEGEPLFAFEARFEHPPRVGQAVTIDFMVLDFTGPEDDSIAVDARFFLPEGWDLVAGQIALQVRTIRHELHWALTARPTRGGRFELRKTLRVDHGRYGLDEGEYVQPIELRTDSTVIGPARPIRLETVRAGQRFRYGDSFLVPIDGPETFTQGDLEERARVVSRRGARCSTCTAGDPDAVSWLVFVDASGRIKGARLASDVDPKSAAVAATRTVLDSWSFSPGKVKGRPVTDWLLVHVPVSR
jgi:hypothetical protein